MRHHRHVILALVQNALDAVERAPNGEIFEAVETLQERARELREIAGKSTDPTRRKMNDQRAEMLFDLCATLLRTPDVRRDPDPDHTKTIEREIAERDLLAGRS